MSPGADREERLQRFRDQVEDRYRHSPLQLYELAVDAPEPCSIGDSSWENGVTMFLGVAYGDPLGHPDGSLAQVISSRVGHGPDAKLLLALEHRERGLGPVEETWEDLVEAVVDGERMEAGRIRTQLAWVARVEMPDVVVTVSGVRWEPDRIELRTMADIGPYLAGWDRLIGLM